MSTKREGAAVALIMEVIPAAAAVSSATAVTSAAVNVSTPGASTFEGVAAAAAAAVRDPLVNNLCFSLSAKGEQMPSFFGARASPSTVAGVEVVVVASVAFGESSTPDKMRAADDGISRVFVCPLPFLAKEAPSGPMLLLPPLSCAWETEAVPPLAVENMRPRADETLLMPDEAVPPLLMLIPLMPLQVLALLSVLVLLLMLSRGMEPPAATAAPSAELGLVAAEVIKASIMFAPA
jgi:hypothetical protein